MTAAIHTPMYGYIGIPVSPALHTQGEIIHNVLDIDDIIPALENQLPRWKGVKK